MNCDNVEVTRAKTEDTPATPLVLNSDRKLGCGCVVNISHWTGLQFREEGSRRVTSSDTDTPLPFCLLTMF